MGISVNVSRYEYIQLTASNERNIIFTIGFSRGLKIVRFAASCRIIAEAWEADNLQITASWFEFLYKRINEKTNTH